MAPQRIGDDYRLISKGVMFVGIAVAASAHQRPGQITLGVYRLSAAARSMSVTRVTRSFEAAMTRQRMLAVAFTTLARAWHEAELPRRVLI